MIDKLDLKLPESVEREKFELDLAKKGLEPERRRLSNGHHGLGVEGVEGFCAYLGRTPYSSHFFKLIINPSKFKNFKNLDEFLKFVFGDTVESFSLSRIDLAVDIEVPFSKVIEEVDFAYKQSCLRFEGKSGVATGLYLGKYPEELAVYDKSQKKFKRCLSDLTRFELRLFKNKMPCRFYSDLADLERYHKNYLSFSRVRQNVKKLDCDELQLSRKDLKNYSYLRGAIEAAGFHQAKKALNKKRNFNVKYKKFFNQDSEILDWDLQNKLESSITSFFKN